MSTILRLSVRQLPRGCLLFKHSTACPLSAAAAREVGAIETELPIYQVTVPEQRELANWIAATYGVVHQSPQLILVRDGRTQRVWNHGEVRRPSVESVLRANERGASKAGSPGRARG